MSGKTMDENLTESGSQNQTTKAGGQAGQADPNLNQIRDLLVGPQLTTLQGRIEENIELVAKLGIQVRDLGTACQDRCDDLAKDLERQRNDLENSFISLRGEFEPRFLKLESGLEDLTGMIDSVDTSQGEKISESINVLRSEIGEMVAVVNARLDTEISGLRDCSVDRSSLAAAFSEVTMRLSGMPGLDAMDPSHIDEVNVDQLFDESGR